MTEAREDAISAAVARAPACRSCGRRDDLVADVHMHVRDGRAVVTAHVLCTACWWPAPPQSSRMQGLAEGPVGEAVRQAVGDAVLRWTAEVRRGTEGD